MDADMSMKLLGTLENEKFTFGIEPAARRLAALQKLGRARLTSAAAVLRLHELLCFMRAYPDNQKVLKQCKQIMAAFGQRSDVQRFREELENSGIAGTAITYPFYAATAERLAQRWPQNLSIVWGQYENTALLDSQLQPMALWSETPGLDEMEVGAKKWLNELRGKQADGAFVARRLAEIYPDAFTFEIIFEQLRLTMQLEPSHDSPSRTHAAAPVKQTHFQTGPVRAQRPVIAEVLREQPRAIRELSRQEGQRYVEMARNAMVTRERDLDAFAYADANDVRLVEWEDGLTFVAMGLVPERRLMLESVYGFLTLRNGVPMGYVLNSALSGSAEIAYNVFDTFRGGEAGWIYGRVLATVKALFGVDSFTIYPYQLGHKNNEALESGAWWFYQKLGFRPRSTKVLALMKRELAAMKRTRGHRSSIATLRKLAAENVYYHEHEQRDDIIGLMKNDKVGLAVTRMIAKRFGGDRVLAERECHAEAIALLGKPRGLAGGCWFRRWAPLVTMLPRVASWSVAERKALLEVIIKKGSRRESDFVHAFDQHRKLRKAIAQLSRRLSSAVPGE